MNCPKEAERLAQAATTVAITLLEIINAKVEEALCPTRSGGQPMLGASLIDKPVATSQGWVNKKAVANHFGISQRTVDNWMKRGLLPYIRPGKSVRFKLTDVDEAVNRLIKIHGR